MFVEDYKYALVEGMPRLNKVTVVMRDVNKLNLDKIADSFKSGEPVRIVREGHLVYNLELSPSTMSETKVKKVIYNKPATIVFWSDGTKTVVVCDKKDKYDPEKGFYIACAKKLFGNNYRAVGRMNKALDLAVDVTKKDK